MRAATPPNEPLRLDALRRYTILDTPLEVAFDDITRLVAYICKTPIAVVNFIDANRQWFKSEVGLGVRETPLDPSICAHAILQSDLFVVPDTTKDDRFSANPLVTGDPLLRFYAGALLKSDDGFALGTLCVLDTKPRELSSEQLEALQILARQVMVLLNLRIALTKEEETSTALRKSEDRLAALNQELALDHHMIGDLNRNLERRVTERTIELEKANDRIQITLEEKIALTQEIHHRVKNNLQIVISLLRLQSHDLTDPVAREMLQESQNRIHSMALVHELIFRSKDVTKIRLQEYFSVFAHYLFAPQRLANRPLEHTLEIDDIQIDIDTAIPCGLILNELIANAKHQASTKQGQNVIAISFRVSADEHCILKVVDHGGDFEGDAERKTNASLGFRIIHALVAQLKGTLDHTPTPGGGSTFTLTFASQNKVKNPHP